MLILPTMDENTDGRRSEEWRISPYVLARCAGLPFTDLLDLSLTETSCALDELSVWHSQLRHESEALCDLIYRGVAAQDDEQRKLLVAAKRCIFNQRKLSSAQMSVLTVVFGQAFVERVKAYYHFYAQIGMQESKVERLFEAEMGQKRISLRALLVNDDFQKALLITQPELHLRLRHYLGSDPTNLKKRDRATEAKLLRYIVRASTKTSPFSRFGPVALGCVGEGETTLQADQFTMRGQIAFSQSVAAFILTKISRQRALWTHLLPTINRTLQIVNSELVFYGRKLVETSNTLHVEPVRRTGKSQPLLMQLISILQTMQPNQPTLEAFLREALRQLVPDSASALTVQRTIDAMIQSDLIMLTFPVHSDRFERLEELRDHLLNLSTPEAHRLAELLNELQSYAQCYQGETVDVQVKLIDQMSVVIGKLIQWNENEQGAMGYAGYLFEDVEVEGLQFHIGQDFLDNTADNLSVLLDALVARDGNSMGYQIIKDIFLYSYPPDAAPSLREFTAQYRQQFQQANFPSPHTSAYLKRQEDFMASLVARCAQGGGDVSDFLRQYAPAGATRLEEPQSLCVLAQIAARDWQSVRQGDFQLVVNSVLPGFGRYFSRYTRLFAHRGLSEQIASGIAAYSAAFSGNAEAVDVLSVLDINAHIHPPFTTRQIVPEDEVSSMPAGQQIPTSTLCVRYDATQDRVILSDGSSRLYPMYMGFVHNASLSGEHSILADLSATNLFMPFFAPAEYPSYIQVPEVGQTVHWHRLTVGRLIIQRETWHVNATDVMSLNAETSPYWYFRALRRWAIQTGLPRHVFVRVGTLFNAVKTARQEQTAWGRSVHHKPIYIDFDNPFTLLQLKDQIEKFGIVESLALRFQEMLPNPSQLCLRVGDASYPFELQLQYTRGCEPQ